jgi:hypothetical protein
MEDETYSHISPIARAFTRMMYGDGFRVVEVSSGWTHDDIEKIIKAMRDKGEIVSVCNKLDMDSQICRLCIHAYPHDMMEASRLLDPCPGRCDDVKCVGVWASDVKPFLKDKLPDEAPF